MKTKTMPVVFAMLFCVYVSLATGQTVNQAPEQVQQPEWCNQECVVVNAIPGQGFMAAVEATSSAKDDDVFIDPLQFTKLHAADGSQITPQTVITVGSRWYFTAEDLASPPDLVAVGVFFKAERERIASKPERKPDKDTSPPATISGADDKTPPASNPAAESGSAPQGAAKDGVKNTDGKESVVINCGDKRFAAVCKQYFEISYGLGAGQTATPNAQDNSALVLKVILISAATSAFCAILICSLITFHKAIIHRLRAFWRASRSAKEPAYLKLSDPANVSPPPNIRRIDSGRPSVPPPPPPTYNNIDQPLRGMERNERNWELPPVEFNTRAKESSDFEWSDFGRCLQKRLRSNLSRQCELVWVEEDVTYKSGTVFLAVCERCGEDALRHSVERFVNSFAQELAFAFLGYGTLNREECKECAVYRVGTRDINRDWPTLLATPTTATEEPVVEPTAVTAS
jgi:hypothetical protein